MAARHAGGTRPPPGLPTGPRGSSLCGELWMLLLSREGVDSCLPGKGERHHTMQLDNAPTEPQNSHRGSGQHQHLQPLRGTNPRAARHMAPVREVPKGHTYKT